MLRKTVAQSLLLTAILFSSCANSSVIISPDSVIDAPPTVITGFSYDRTIDQSGLSLNFTSGLTDFDTYVAQNPTHTGSNTPQTYAASTRLPNPYLNVDYDLGSTYVVEKMAFWNYPFPDSAAIVGINVYTSDTADFLTSLLVGTFSPISDGNRITNINEVQIFDLLDSTARYLRLQITATETTTGNGFSELALGVTPVPLPAAVWLFGSGMAGLIGFSRRKNAA